MNRGSLYLWMAIFAVAGIVTSLYLTYLSLAPPTSCPVGEFAVFSCDEVIWSTYSKIYGVSVAVLGLAWFVVALGLIVLARSIQRFLPIVVVWSLIGLVGVAWFVYVEVFLIGSICLLCTLAHLMGVLILVSAIVALRSVGWKDR